CKHSVALALILAGTAAKSGNPPEDDIENDYSEILELVAEDDFPITGIERLFGSISKHDHDSVPEDWWNVVAANSDWPMQERVSYSPAKQRLPTISPMFINQFTKALKAERNPIRRLP